MGLGPLGDPGTETPLRTRTLGAGSERAPLSAGRLNPAAGRPGVGGALSPGGQKLTPRAHPCSGRCQLDCHLHPHALLFPSPRGLPSLCSTSAAGADEQEGPATGQGLRCWDLHLGSERQGVVVLSEPRGACKVVLPPPRGALLSVFSHGGIAWDCTCSGSGPCDVDRSLQTPRVPPPSFVEHSMSLPHRKRSTPGTPPRHPDKLIPPPQGRLRIQGAQVTEQRLSRCEACAAGRSFRFLDLRVMPSKDQNLLRARSLIPAVH